MANATASLAGRRPKRQAPSTRARAGLAPAVAELASAFAHLPAAEARAGIVSFLVRTLFADLATARGLLEGPAGFDATLDWPSALRRVSAEALGKEGVGLFDVARDRRLLDAPSTKEALAGALGRLRAFANEWRAKQGPAVDDSALLGGAFEELLDVRLVRAGGALVVARGDERARTGAHYTAPSLTRSLVSRTLAPVLASCTRREELLGLRLCDPSMGAGAFLIEATRQLAAAMARIDESRDLAAAMREVATTCVHGVDLNAFAVDVARLGLWLGVGDRRLDPRAFDRHLVVGDALVPGRSFEWRRSFPEVLDGRAGFDAMIGNPPWVSYVGRAAQPLSERLRRAYAESPAFGGFKNLQALFVHRAATLVRPEGRLGFVLPTSMSDLDGYRISRRSHDELCDVDRDLPDFGNSFEGVFQPCMGLLSTKRARAREATGAPWPLVRAEIDGDVRRLLDRLERLPRFAAQTFGERGFQTVRGDVARLRGPSDPTSACSVALRAGSDVGPFERRPATFYADPSDFQRRLRPPDAWRAVKLLIRQTARFPMVALSDGLAFRNSVLAGFTDPRWSEHFLVGYLNSAPVRFYHYARHRDARQGMPQLKIGHLRALPAPPCETEATRAIEALGRELGERNEGLSADERDELDRLSAEVLELSRSERDRVGDFARSVKG